MKIYLGTDHAGYELKETVKQYLTEAGHEVIDCGAAAFDEYDSYVGYVAEAARGAAQDPKARAIIMGGSGQGEAMAANRIKGVRAAVYYAAGSAAKLDHSGAPGKDDGFDIVRLSRHHNNSNVLSIGARFVTVEQAKQAIDVWLQTSFADDPRYDDRNQELDAIEP